MRVHLFAKIFVTMASATFLASCAETPVAKDAVVDPKASSEITIFKDKKDELSLTGKTVFVSPMTQSLEKSLNVDHRAALEKLVKENLRAQGFVIVDKFAKGYSTVYLASDLIRPTVEIDPKTRKMTKLVGFAPVTKTDQNISSTTYTSVMVNGKMVASEQQTLDTALNRLSIQWFINQHGKRPVFYANADFLVMNSLDSVWTELQNKILSNLSEMKFTPAAQNLKMSGEPGCFPRFGFEVERRDIGTKTIFKVSKVIAKSGAQKAGLQVGDFIEAIDSIPYETWEADNNSEHYNQKIAVPIKFSRDGDTIRGSIKPEVSCEG